MTAKPERRTAVVRVCMVALSLALAPGSSRAGPPEPVQDEVSRRPLLLVMTEPDEFGDTVARAITTELNDVKVRLEAVALTPTLELGDRIEVGERLVQERDALGLVWIEARPDGLVVHLVVADAGMLRRPIVGLEDRTAAVETAAVIVRHFVVDLLAGRPIGLTRFEPDPEPVVEDEPRDPPIVDSSDQPPEREPDPAPPPIPWLRERGHLRLAAGYAGQTWIRERAWENGVEVALGWRFAFGAHLELGAGFAPAFEAELVHPANLGAAQLRVRRYPIALAVGYQHLWPRPRLALDAMLRIGADVIERGVFDPNDITPQLERPTVAVPVLEPRLALAWFAIPQIAVFVAVGARTSLVRVDYRVAYTDAAGEVIGEERPLTPRVVAPVVLAGLDMFF